MTAAAPRSFFSSRFFIGLVSLALVLAALGGSVFRYLTMSARIGVAQNQPIAVATTFVPATAPLSFSLLTSPEALLVLSQADAADEQITSEIQQLKRNFQTSTGLDYDRDLSPWLGNEVTFALIDTDLDSDSSNGEQAGYLIAAAIAPLKQREAREFLQRLWQRRSLEGAVPLSEQVSGVRVLHSDRIDSVTAVSALVGDRFILFANDMRVLRRSIRSAQSATNLAQTRAYRNTVAQLPIERVGLAYLNSALIGLDDAGRSRTAVSIELAPNGVLAQLQRTDGEAILSGIVPEGAEMEKPIDAMKFVPAGSTLAIAGRDLSQLLPALYASEISEKDTPRFIFLGNPQKQASEWAWADEGYALGRVDSDWVLSVQRDVDGIARLDEIAKAKGYSAVPVALSTIDSTESAASEAIAWTRFSAKQSYRANSSIETEVLGLHLQQGEYEIFADTVGAMEQALSAPNNSLPESAQFEQAVEALPTPNSGYLYLDKTTATSLLNRKLPQVQRLLRPIDPLLSHIRSLSAARTNKKDAETMSVFVQMSR